VTGLRRGRLVAVWLLGIYLAESYVHMGWSELQSDTPPPLRTLLGGLEVLGGATLVIPWLASYGGFLLSLVTAAAWGTLAHDHRWAEVARATLYIAGLTWIAYEWLGLRLGGGASPRGGDAEA
jgi:hypothetical protein